MYKLINITNLFSSVLVLFIMIIPGFLLRKLKFAGDELPKGLTNIILYVAQPALIIVSFIRPYEPGIMKTALGVLIFSFVLHGAYFGISLLFFRNAGEAQKRVYRFGSVFANAGYMGIPLIMTLFGSDAAIYPSFYIIGFNFYCWSAGCLIYSGDRSFVSPKKMFLNPATIPTYIGLIFFLLPIDRYVPSVIVQSLDMLRSIVAPLSMMLVGIRLADMKLKGAFSDAYMYLALGLRLLIFPAVAWGVVKLVALTGLYVDDMAMTIVLICSATPCAAATSMFAEKFNGDTVTAGKFVSISSILSVITMPLVALLLKI